MIKRVLIPAITAIVGIGISYGIYQTAKPSKVYNSRALKANMVPHSMAESKLDLNSGQMNYDLIQEERSRLKHMNQRGDLGLTFVNRGPDNVGGRTRAILEKYGNPSKLFAGSVTGGLFISENGGATWTPHLQFQNLDSNSSIISCIHEDTINNIIYVGTGSSFDDSFDAFPGFGIFKSTDGGETFQHIASTTPSDRFSNNADAWLFVNRIRTNNQGHIYAATDRSLLLSTDGGSSWTNVLYLGTTPQSGTCADVAVTSTGKVLASLANGRIYLSEDGTDGSFELINTEKGLPSSADRTCVTISPQNEDIMYVMWVDDGSASPCFKYIYKSTNGGDSWNLLLQQYGDFDPMNNGQYCQSSYDATLHVSAVNPNIIFIGGVQIWRYDGNLTRVASEGGAPPVQDILPNYVHADKHYMASSPNNPSRMYVTSDGGLTYTENEGSTWQGINKGYVTTQFYGIAVAPEGNIVMGGCQDNGTPVILGTNPNDPMAAFSASGGDGFTCAISQYTGIYFSTSQTGVVYRGENGLPSALISGSGGGDFYTNVALWESENEPSSKDSLIFSVDPFVQSIATSNGIIRTYTETIYPVQPAAIVIKNSVKVVSGSQELTLAADLSTLEGDGTGTVTFNTDGSISIQATFDVAPSENSTVDVEYEVRFEANSILYVESKNMKSNTRTYEFEHRLESDLNPGDQIKIQDPAQSLLASDAFNGLHIYRNVLNSSDNPQGKQIQIPGINGVQSLEFSKDGDVLFVGTFAGTVWRVKGLKNLYTNADVQNLEISQILGGLGSSVYGIAVDPNDANRVVVTSTGFGASNRVRFSQNALATSPSFVNVHGNLPKIPVYAATFDVNNPNFVIVGTEFGVFATADITQGANTSWSNESNETGIIPVYDIVQQQLPWNESKNTGKLYLGTFGRGIFESTDLVGIKDFDGPIKKESISELSVYPNPLRDFGTIKFNSAKNGTIEISVYDLNGRVVKGFQAKVAAGENKIQFNTLGLKTGTYFMTIGNGNSLKSSKFVVLN